MLISVYQLVSIKNILFSKVKVVMRRSELGRLNLMEAQGTPDQPWDHLVIITQICRGEVTWVLSSL